MRGKSEVRVAIIMSGLPMSATTPSEVERPLGRLELTLCDLGVHVLSVPQPLLFYLDTNTRGVIPLCNRMLLSNPSHLLTSMTNHLPLSEGA